MPTYDLGLEHVSLAFATKNIFTDVTQGVFEGDRIGIVGKNGDGKSTLLHLFKGTQEPDSGRVTMRNGLTFGMLDQRDPLDDNATVREAALEGREDYEWAAETKSREIVEALLGGISLDAKIGSLSGGQRRRADLARLLLKDWDILALDEPTNHLDGDMADWLEETLKAKRCTLLMVTHDRYFLDSVANRIVEIERGHIYSYATNYAGYLEAKMQREESALASERKRQSILRTELEWVRRGARARSTKQKARLERYEELKNRQAPEAAQNVELGSVSSRLGRTTIELEQVSKCFGEKVLFRDFSYIFLKNDRVGFVGKNGCGKTTLMRMIAGQIQPDEGHVVVGQTVRIGYYQQECAMPEGKRVIDYIRDVAEIVDTPEGKVTASKMLEQFLFSGEDQYGLIGKLSGGEKRRLNLCRVLMEGPNVLILDEPTNDLDIATLTVLENYLDQFQGIVIAVSHDRYFLDRTMHRIFSFEGSGKIRQYEGGYSDYMLRKEMESAEAEPAPGQPTEKQPSAGRTSAPRKLKFSYKEQKEYETIEADIAGLEEKIAGLEARIPMFSSDFVKLQELTAEKEKAEAELEEKMERWMYLEDLAARIAAGEMQPE